MKDAEDTMSNVKRCFFKLLTVSPLTTSASAETESGFLQEKSMNLQVGRKKLIQNLFVVVRYALPKGEGGYYIGFCQHCHTRLD